MGWSPLLSAPGPNSFDVPAHKDIDTQTVADLRRMLNSSGYGPDVEEAGDKGQEDR